MLRLLLLLFLPFVNIRPLTAEHHGECVMCSPERLPGLLHRTWQKSTVTLVLLSVRTVSTLVLFVSCVRCSETSSQFFNVLVSAVISVNFTCPVVSGAR